MPMWTARLGRRCFGYLNPVWVLASECAMTPVIRLVRRVNTAMFNASITRSVVIVDATRHPTIARECTSMMNAV